jgi:hypothetical protein
MAALPAVIAVATTAASTGMAIAQARQQNKAIEQQQDLAQRNAELQSDRLRRQAEIERMRTAREADQIRGRLRVASTAAGTGRGGTYQALARQATVDESLNLQLIGENLNSQLQATRLGAQSQFAELDAGISNPLLASFTGALGGAQAGLSIGRGVQEIMK